MLTARRMQRHLNLEVLLRTVPAPAWSAAALFAAWRLLVARGVLVAGVVFVLAAAAVALLRFRRGAWSQSAARVALDRAAGAGGLVLALAEARGPEWQERLAPMLRAAALPRRALAGPAAATAGAIAFAVVAALAPLPHAQVAPVQTAALAKVEDLAAQGEALAREGALAKELAAELARLEQDARAGRFDAADWAGADALAESMAQAAGRRAQDLSNAAEAAENLARALEQGTAAEQQARARQALEQALMAMAGREVDGRPGGDGAQARAQQMASGARGAADARALQEALARRSFQVVRSQGKSALVSYDFTPGAGAARQAAPGIDVPGNGQGPRASGEGKMGDGAECAGGKDGDGRGKGEVGRGGVARGPGAAPVTFGEPTPLELERLQADALPPNPNDEQGALTGISAVAPEVKPGAAGPPGAAASGPEGLGAHAAPLSPRQRSLVKRYFEPRAGETR
jgi:hypothetical protein